MVTEPSFVAANAIVAGAMPPKVIAMASPAETAARAMLCFFMFQSFLSADAFCPHDYLTSGGHSEPTPGHLP
jgi:hypothetical protein